MIASAYPDQFESLAGQLNGLTESPEISANVNPYLAAIYAYNIVGKTLIFSEDKMTDFQNQFEQRLIDLSIPRRIRKNSMRYAEKISSHILKWSKTDNYHQTRTYPKYTVLEEDHYWKPTPPDYMDGIEPNWNQIRPMVIKSASQFSPEPPLSFNLKKGKSFSKSITRGL